MAFYRNSPSPWPYRPDRDCDMEFFTEPERIEHEMTAHGVVVRVFRDGSETVVEVDSGGKPVVVRMVREG